MLIKLVEKLGELLFPARCLGCRKPGAYLCGLCLKSSRTKGREKISLPFVDKFFHYGAYEDKILREALRRFKYHGTYGLSRPLAEMLKELIKPQLSLAPEKYFVIPIPASRERLRERGYNQAGLLAQSLAEKISLPCRDNILLKIKNTPSQISLKGRERLFNIKNSFAIQNAEAIQDQSIILIDDISTTGATLSEAARVLKHSGAREVIGVVVARG